MRERVTSAAHRPPTELNRQWLGAAGTAMVVGAAFIITGVEPRFLKLAVQPNFENLGSTPVKLHFCDDPPKVID